MILVTDNPDIESGKVYSGLDTEEDFQGLSGQYNLIYINGNFDPLEGDVWIKNFPQGYSVGKGVKHSGEPDGFEWADPRIIEIIIDRLQNIEYVNWVW